MILVFTMALALWVIGAIFKAPKYQRWITIACLFAAVIALHLALPAAHPLRQNTGGSAVLWIMIAGFGVCVFLYRRGLQWLRGLQKPPAAPDASDPSALSDTELERYMRHIMLRDIGGMGQKQIKNAKVLVVGAGGLGAPVLQYLAAAGVGTLGVIDDDHVDISNLQRQTIHTDEQIGNAKVTSASDAVYAQNPFVTVKPYKRRLTAEIAEGLITEYDLVVDCSDNFETRKTVNAICIKQRIPMVFGALSQWEGQISVFGVNASDPCYACVFPNTPDAADAPNCADVGVFAPLAGVIGTQMAAEALKIITGAGTPLTGRLYIYDALDATSRNIKTVQNPSCGVCGGKTR